jgi:hypothetical protein
MGREYVMGKCVPCEAAFTWKRYRNGNHYRLGSQRCPFCGRALDQTSSQLKKYPWFSLERDASVDIRPDEKVAASFSRPRADFDSPYGTHHFFSRRREDGTRERFLTGLSHKAFYDLVKEIGGVLPRGYHAHHSGTADPRTLSMMPVAVEKSHDEDRCVLGYSLSIYDYTVTIYRPVDVREALKAAVMADEMLRERVEA